MDDSGVRYSYFFFRLFVVSDGDFMNWIKASDQLPPAGTGQVLVVYLMTFFGKFTAEVDVGYYDDPKDMDRGLTRAKEIIETNDLEEAFEFMSLRADYEYEDMDIVYSEKY